MFCRYRPLVPPRVRQIQLPYIFSNEPTSDYSVINPVATHPEVVLYAISSGDSSSSSTLAAKHHFETSYASYAELLTDPKVDFVYISLPTSLHFEWASKSLEAGKHVLLEPPFTSNSFEAEVLVRKAEACEKVLMEGCHWQFHPAAHRLRQIVDSGAYGGIIGTSAGISSTPAIPKDDARWKYELSGGSLISMESVVGLTRYILHAGTLDSVVHAEAGVSEDLDRRVDSSMLATLRFKLKSINPDAEKSDVCSVLYTDMDRAPAYGIVPRFWELPSIRVETEKCEIYFCNFLSPHAYHHIAITQKSTGKTKHEHLFKGGPLWDDKGRLLWSSYRYQLEAVIDKLKGRQPVWWVTTEDSVQQMKSIDWIYEESSLPVRPTTETL